MPEPLKESEVQKGQDPTVTKQWDDDTPTGEKFDDFAAIADKLGVCMMTSKRDGLGSISRAMAVAKRSGPDFLFLANANSQKFDDFSKDSEVTITFQNNSNMDWISITGEVVTTSNEDPRIKEVWNKTSQAWFGNLGDGVHDGSPSDPRIKLIEVQAKYVSYWKHAGVGGIGAMTEAVAAMATGDVAKPGLLRQLNAQEIKSLRSKHGQMSS